ncbi:MAG: LpxL/LpxP family Kdo(2)-lipid IV(A) lauroyl/palmitoleoyl acyltransferase [Gammaproteobacteria bacterium]
MHYELMAPRNWASWIALACMRCIELLPYRAMLAVGRGLGWLAGCLVGKFQRIARRNLELCLPGLSAQQRDRVMRQHFEGLGMALCESSMSWWSSDERIRSLSRIEGCEHLDAARSHGRGTILLTAHFTTLEISARILNTNRPICALYKPLRNPVLAAASNASRERRARHAIRNDDIRAMVRALRNNEIVWYAPDQCYRKKGAQMVPFFGVPAATNTGTTRLAQMTGATVLYLSHERLPDGAGYRLVIHPPVSGIPSGDAVADTARFNSFIEAEVERNPSQYWWIHRRFKGLDAAYPDYYRRGEPAIAPAPVA